MLFTCVSKENVNMQLMKIDYIEVIQSWMDETGASQADIARKTKRTTGAISLVMSGQRKPSPDLLVDIAKALGKPPELALQLAGLLPSPSSDNEKAQELAHLVNEMPDTALDDVLEFARHRLELAEKRGEYETKKSKQGK